MGDPVGRASESRNRSYKTSIAQADDGNVVVRVGCRAFVGQPDDLRLLAEYYSGHVPDLVAGLVKPEQAFKSRDLVMVGPSFDSPSVHPGDVGGLIDGAAGVRTVTLSFLSNGYVVSERGRTAVVLRKSPEVDAIIDRIDFAHSVSAPAFPDDGIAAADSGRSGSGGLAGTGPDPVGPVGPTGPDESERR